MPDSLAWLSRNALSQRMIDLMTSPDLFANLPEPEPVSITPDVEARFMAVREYCVDMIAKGAGGPGGMSPLALAGQDILNILDNKTNAER